LGKPLPKGTVFTKSTLILGKREKNQQVIPSEHLIIDAYLPIIAKRTSVGHYCMQKNPKLIL
jgi:hypothetical protein